MLKHMSIEQVEAIRNAVKGAEYISRATGESVSEVLECHFPTHRPPGLEGRVLQIKERPAC
jgi:hypothetical protein